MGKRRPLEHCDYWFAPSILTFFIFYHCVAYSSFPVNCSVMPVPASSLNVGHWVWISPCVLAQTEWKRNPTLNDHPVLKMMISWVFWFRPRINLRIWISLMALLMTSAVHHWILAASTFKKFFKSFLVEQMKAALGNCSGKQKRGLHITCDYFGSWNWGKHLIMITNYTV